MEILLLSLRIEPGPYSHKQGGWDYGHHASNSLLLLVNCALPYKSQSPTKLLVPAQKVPSTSFHPPASVRLLLDDIDNGLCGHLLHQEGGRKEPQNLNELYPLLMAKSRQQSIVGFV